MSQTLITPSEEKVGQLADLFRHAVRKAGISDQQAQAISEEGGAFQEALIPVIRRCAKAKGRKPKQQAPPSKPAILAPVTTRDLPGSARFSPADHFRTTNTPNGVKIAYLDENFQRLLEAVEENVPALTLRVDRLTERSVDGPILDELGGQAAVEIFLFHLWQLLKAQPTGKRGTLLVNGYANIAYIKGWAVRASWDEDLDGWRLGALPVTYPCPWGDGDRVLSRVILVPSGRSAMAL